MKLIKSAVFLIALLGASCNKTPRLPTDVILIVADTLRPDHLGAYGHPAGTSPNLDRLAADSVIFENVYAPVPSTLPSHVSLITGLYPDTHRVVGAKDGPLSPEIATLAEKLKGLGYTNFGAISSIWLEERFGFGRGFDDYRVIEDDLTAAPMVNAAAFELIDRLAQTPGKRFFLFLHYYDPHSDFYRFGENRLPYYADEPFLKRFGRDLSALDAAQDELKSYATDYLVAVDDKKLKVSPEVREALVSLYDAGIAYFDQQLGKVIERLKKDGLYDESLIIFTSDHGEEFREHGEFLHNQPYEESIRVPLLVKFPQGENRGKRVKSPVELIDIYPAVLDYLGLSPDEYVQGISFLPLIEYGKTRTKPVFARQKSPDRARVYSLKKGRYKLVYDFSDGRAELYNLKADPGEKTDIAEKEPELAAYLEKKLIKTVKENASLAGSFKKSGGKPALSSKEIEKLKSLGYLSD